MKSSVLCMVLAVGCVAFAQDNSASGSQKKDTGSQTTSTTTTSTTTTTTSTDPSKVVPVLDAGLGACSAEFRVTDKDSKPIYGAQIHTLIRSRAFGLKKTDLQVSTNYEGKAKFTGLPDVNKKPTFFDISQGQKKAVREFSPGENCHPVFDVMLGTEVVVDKSAK